MMLRAGADTDRPGKHLPPGTTILFVYVGDPRLPGAPDARHIWTRAEINEYLDPASPLYGGPDLRVVPIFVHDFPGDPVAIADNIADALIDLGWSDKLGRLVYLDLETLIAPAYVAQVSAQLARRGFTMGKYGSQGTINSNPPVPGGTWMATDSKAIPLVLPPDRIADQWLFGGDWDLTGADEFVWLNAGVGLRKARP